MLTQLLQLFSWLAIPVAAVLCLTLAPRTVPTPMETPGFLLDEEVPEERSPRRVAPRAAAP